MTGPSNTMTGAEEEFLAFGWEVANFQAPDTGAGRSAVTGYRKGDFAAYATDQGWEVMAVPADLLLGRLPSASAVRRFAQKFVSFPAVPNGAVIGAARQAMLQAVEEELVLARHAAQALENRIDDLMSSIDDIRAKAILFAKPENEEAE